MGRGCGFLFFGIFFLIGSIVTAVFFWQLILPVWRANTVYVAHTCVVLDKRVAESRGDDGSTYRPEIQIRYTVAGREYTTWAYDAAKIYSSGRDGKQKIIDQFQAGREYPCWYDPTDPEKVVLVRGYSWTTLFALIPLVFVAVGVGGMYFSLRGGRKSRRPATISPDDQGWPQRQDDEIGAAADASVSYDELPTVPTRDLSNSPGTTLKYRLSMGVMPGCAVIGALVVAIFWNGITSIFVVLAVNSHLKGRPEWFLTIFIIPFVLIGIGLVFFFFKQLLVATGVGATVAEISDHPLRPGAAYQVFVSQSGNMQMNSLRVLLVCEESATYRQGTSTSTDTKRVKELELFRNEGFEIQKGLPYESRCELRVPPDAMHSFEESHNKIQWKLVVSGDVAGWPDFSRDFPLVVLPASPAGGDT